MTRPFTMRHRSVSACVAALLRSKMQRGHGRGGMGAREAGGPCTSPWGAYDSATATQPARLPVSHAACARRDANEVGGICELAARAAASCCPEGEFVLHEGQDADKQD
jgi:hypothetical protein